MSFYHEKIHSIRFKLISSLIVVCLFVCLISVLVGGNMLYRSVLGEANHRIQQDLNVARVIYDNRINEIRLALDLTAAVPEYCQTACANRTLPVAETMDQLATRLQLDFLGITNSKGQMGYQYGSNSSKTAEQVSRNPLVKNVLQNKEPVAGTVILNREQLLSESSSLKYQSGTEAMVIGVAIPIFSNNNLEEVIYGGVVLNNDPLIVDKIGETVFKNEIYKGRNVGTSTIFYKDLRIATSVKDSSGNRAVGTLASSEVANHVLKAGEKWTNRAKVLDDWYITAYEPILDISGDRVGMLYVGVLEAKYLDIRRKAFIIFAGTTLVGVLIAIVLGWLFTGKIMSPVTHLIRASAEISDGNLSPDIGPISKDDIGRLQQNFLVMTEALKEKEKRHKVEHETHLLQSEKQASVGKLAAGVAHEINNPLTAVLTFTHLILRRKDLPEEVRKDLDIVTTQTERVRKIVKSLLDFSRQTVIKPESLQINRLIEDSLGLMKNQALIRDVTLTFKGEEKLPSLTLDKNQFQSVIINLIINALDATPSGGSIAITTQKIEVNSEEGVEINISDTGCGIPADNMEQLFDPFFTTKEVGKGTGLGLAVTMGIIERHSGTIKVRSQVDKGTTFTIWMPCRISKSLPDYQDQ